MALTDTAIIGHLGTVELAGVGVGSSLFLLLVWMLAQTKSAISAIVSRYFGMQKTNEIGTFVVQSLVFNLVIGFLTIAVTLYFTEFLFSLYNAEGRLLTVAIDYYRIRIFGLPLALATYGLFGVFRGFQNTSWAMFISLFGGILNIILDFLLVYGFENFVPAYGVEGAAWASLIAQTIMFFVAIWLLVKKKLLPLSFDFKFDKNIKEFVQMFGNLLIRTIALNTAYFLGTKYATSYGQEYIAAHTIAMNIWLFSSFFIDGYATAGNAIAGKLLGQKNSNGIAQIGKAIYRMSILVGLGLGAFYLAGYLYFGQLFSNDIAVITAFESVFWLVIVSQPINGLSFGLDGIFKGLGKAAFLRNTLLVATFMGFVPTLLLFDYFGYGLHAVWIAFLVFMTFRAFTLLWKFNRDYSVKNFS
ncbi:MAG: MATE family efflux transporter [Flavobacteriales bacterium]|nr:MATE family efflux transporter [Flavobacteriales bacterium]